MAAPDLRASAFTQPAAELGGSSISITGFRSAGVATLLLANGPRVPVLSLAADEVAVDGFLLDARTVPGPPLVTTAKRMDLRGHVIVYLDLVTATLGDGTAVTFGAHDAAAGRRNYRRRCSGSRFARSR